MLKDYLLSSIDNSLRTLWGKPHATRPTPTPAAEARGEPLGPEARALSGALMRVNHVGEVCAQALYTGQALGARVFHQDERLAQQLEAAGREETDHLAWTQQRLNELGARPSILNPLWHAGAFALGVAAAAVGRGASLGFVVETERQVEAHLAGHMQRLPAQDHASRAVVAQMQADEARHAQEAKQLGARDVPAPLQAAMRAMAKVMTTVAHRV
ncbi:MAG: 2-polyprenyl-3-methyl-6-methoxy-1,4-benzoquinone monooxygenase [Burkholderiaceae bacterium]